ncbi:T6SS effector BTH_I2691 family protein [Variovorax sp. YR752]|uniref:T6SS effector BTH_I2691 family protein n=1 Tax=Variovorax sp. YR752 TaxID=1884383 RepID=UPI003138426D
MSDCRICDNKAGLSILLVRPGAIATDADFAPAEAPRLLTHEPSVKALSLPALKKSRHVLRMLRQGGFVYVYYTKCPPQLIKSWQAYRVQGSGALVPESQIVWADREASFACSVKPTHPNDVRTLCIQLPEKEPGSAGPVWIGFSMNWWDDTMRAQVQANPAAAGMVCIDSRADLGGVSHAFKAEEALIQKHVADFALRSMKHGGIKEGINVTQGGTESATPFYGASQDKTYRLANGMAAAMRRQAEQHATTRGKAFVLAIPDPVGLAADLNGIRLARDKAFKDATLQSPEAWPTASHATLNALQAAMKTAGMARAESEAYGSTSREQWEQLRGQPYFQVGFAWEPAADGSLAADGSRNGRIVEPGNIRRTRRIGQRGERIGESEWHGIANEIDALKRKEWQKTRDTALGKEAELLSAYELDWLHATKHPATLDYFKRHFDENSPNKLTEQTRNCPGAIYASESHLIHFPQPLSTPQCFKDYLAHTLDKPITDAQAIALRAMFGNQKNVIEQAHAVLVGEWDRAGENMRDKTYDLIKGLLTTEAGRKYSWLTNVVATFSIGQIAAFTAAATQMLNSPKTAPVVEPYLRKLPKVCLAHRGFEAALEAALNGGRRLDMPVLLELKLNARDAVAILAGKSAAAKATEWVVSASKGEVKMWALTSLDALQQLRDPTSIDPGRAPAKMPNAGGDPLAELKVRAASLGAIELTPNSATRVLQYQNERAIGAAREIKAENFKSGTDARLALGSLFVQGLGMYWGIKALMEAYSGDGPAAEKKRHDAWLSVGDSASGLATAFFELAHAGHSMRLVGQGGAAAMQASAVLPALRLGAALAGVGGGVINAWISWDKADVAKENANDVAYGAYTVAGFAFMGTAITSTALATEAGAQAALKRFASQRVLVIIAGSIVGGMEASVAGFAVASIISGVGLVLLGAGIVATLIAMQELTPLEKWANRSFFGKGNRGVKFTDGHEEQLKLDEALAPPKPVATPEPAPYPTPAYDPRQRSPTRRTSS